MRAPAAGELRARIKISRWEETPADDGGLDRVLTELCTVWTKCEPVGAQMFWGTAQIEESVTHRFWLRTVPGQTDVRTLRGDTQCEYRGALFRVKRVSDYEERGVWTILEAEELGVDNGD